MKNIFTKLLYETNEGRDVEIVTIIKHKGSTPRESGTQMLVDGFGNMYGTIGGGAVENEARLLAVDLIAEKKSTIHDYILKINSVEDIGMVCGGNVSVHFQFVASDDHSWKELAKKIIKKIDDREQGCLVLKLDGSLAEIKDAVDCRTYDLEKEYAIPLPIGERAIVFGAGHCALALAPLLYSLGFRVTMFDDRPELLTPERYPQAEKLICGDFERVGDYFDFTPEDYVVIMTSGHTYDYTVEKTILNGEYAYLGVIGSRKKTATINKKLREDGVCEEKIESVHTPIGLPIMAQTPEEIAVSIAGEMILERAKIRMSKGEIKTSCPMHTPGA